MSVGFKSPLSSNNVNTAFISKINDDATVGKLGFANADAISGNAITNIQQFANEMAESLGYTGEGDPLKDTYSSNNYILNGDDRKVAIGKLDAAIASVIADTKKLVSFASDNDYEISFGGPTGGEIYYNSTSGMVRYYDAVEAEWRNIGSSSVGAQELIGTGNGAQTLFSLTFVPTNDEGIIVHLNGVTVEKTDYSVSGGDITFNTAPSAGQRVYAWYLTDGTPASGPVNGITPNTEFRTISAGEESAEVLILGQTPDTGINVLIDQIGGTTQEFGVDYSIVGNEVRWIGLDPDNVFIENNKFRISYYF